MKVQITVDTEFESVQDLQKLHNWVTELIQSRVKQQGLSSPQKTEPIKQSFAEYVQETEQTIQKESSIQQRNPFESPGIQKNTAKMEFNFSQPIEEMKPLQSPQTTSFQPAPRQEVKENKPRKTAGGCEIMDYEDMGDMMSKIFSGEKLG